MKSNSTIKPDAFRRAGRHSKLYAWNIEERTDTNESGAEYTTYDYEEVEVHEPITANKVVAAVIAATWDSTYEQKLVNEYNAAVNGLYDDETAETKKAAYLAFLQERQALKEQVDSDCEEHGIA